MTVHAPTLENTAGIFSLTFESELLDIRLDRIDTNSKHETTGEITIKSRRPAELGHVHQARLNLTSSTTRSTMAKYLTTKIPTVEWDKILEYTCIRVLEKHREGTPIVHLADYQVPEGLRHRLFPYLQEKQASLLFGEGDTGKSWLALMMGVTVAIGTPQLGLQPEPGAVLFLDYETDEDTVWERVNMVSAGFGEPIPEGFYYRQMHQTIAADFQQVNQLVMDHNISLVIVDSAAPAVGEPEASQATNEYFRALRSLRCSSLTVAHVSKGGKETEPFGSIFWRNLPRANYRVDASHEPGAQSFAMQIKHTKSNNGKRLQDRAYELTFEDDLVRFKFADIAAVPEFAEGMTLGQRISAVLKNGALSVKDIAEMLEANENSVKTTLNRHKGDMFSIVNQDGFAPSWGNSFTPHNS